MRRSMLVSACALVGLTPWAARAQHGETGFLDRVVQVGSMTYKYEVYVPAAYAASTARWPAILFLHGAGERGDNGLVQTNVGLATAIRRTPEKFPAIVIMPQVPADSLWIGSPADAAIAALDRTMAEFRIDLDRVYLTGLSMGGNGTWNLAYRFPDRWAAIAPICAFVTPVPQLRSRSIVPADSGDAFTAIAGRIGRTPTWIFHGEMDPVVPVTESRRMADALKGNPNARYTEFLGMGHSVWDATYGSEQFQTWLFAQRRSP